MEAKETKVSAIRYSSDELPTVKYARNIFESTCVLVANMYSGTSVTDVYNVFVRFGAIKNLKMYESGWKPFKRYAHVHFDDKLSAETARKELHLTRDTKLTYKNSPLIIKFVDTAKKRAKWYNYTAIVCNECLYWRVYGECEVYNKKLCLLNHDEVCKGADCNYFLRKTLEMEGYGPKSNQNLKRITTTKGSGNYFEDRTRLNYENLIRNVLRIEWPFEDTVSDEVQLTKEVKKSSLNWDSDDVYITIPMKEKIDVPWPSLKT